MIHIQQYQLFCDEAGNTGLDVFRDVNQPFYVSAGICIDTNNVDACRDFVRDFAKRYNQGSELKGRALMNRGRGRQVAARLLRGVAERGCVPLFVLIEKKFSLAARFVDEFLDPSVNLAVQWEYCRDKDRMLAAAKVIHRLSDAVLRTVQSALENVTYESRRAAVEAVLSALRDAGEYRLSLDVSGALIEPERLRPDLNPPDYARMLRLGNTANVAALSHLFRNLETIARQVPFAISKVIHDETSSMEEVLRFFQSRMADPDFTASVNEFLPEDGLLVLEAVPQTEFARSVEEPMIQAADVLAAAVAHSAKAAAAGRKLDASELDLVQLTLHALLLEIPVCQSVVSDKFAKDIGRVLRNTLPPEFGGE